MGSRAASIAGNRILIRVANETCQRVKRQKMPGPIITLTTDFGLSDSYVAQMKAVILRISPDARLIDVTHHVPPQDCEAAAEILADAVGAFLVEAIHLVVVDPGVGTDRRAVAVEVESTAPSG